MNKYRLRLKKDSGDRALFTGLAVLFCIVVTAILIYMSVDYNSEINKNNKVEQIMRTYIEKMETSGYLTDTQKDSLQNELAAVGCSNIRYGTTSFTKVTYGEYVYLDIYYDIKIVKWSFTDGSFFKAIRSEEIKQDVHKYRKGTAQY